MEYKNLGKSGLRVSALSYGAWVTFGKQVDVAAAKNLLSIAYDAGVNFFDNAEAYENGLAEDVMGQALAELGWDRSAWCVIKPNVSTVILGASKAPQLEENLNAINDLKKLTPDVVERIEAAADWAKPEPEPTFLD